MALTYEPIASTTLSSEASIVFTSIPQTYTDLVLVTNLIKSSIADLDVILNNDTTSTYSFISMYGNGSSTGSTKASSITYARLDYLGYIGTTFSHVNTANFFNYSNTSVYKTIISRGNNTSNGVGANACLWRSTAAITSIEIVGTCGIGSNARLYGIKAA